MNLNDLDPNIIIPSLVAAYAAIKSNQAAKYAKPTGNGFAQLVIRKLDRIDDRIDKHLENHKNGI